ncbi:hypothetical protein BDF14DRAFT_155838 [Spinellus fusiger]|nr:hypothetical protein BDF14DRAFT_155838 [Spinellus fusiger]
MIFDPRLLIKDANGKHINLLNDSVYPSPPTCTYSRDALEADTDTRKALSKRRKYICTSTGCHKSFTTSGHLARHNRIHTGEKNFSCLYPGCPSRFSRQDNMMQHYRTHASPKTRRCRLQQYFSYPTDLAYAVEYPKFYSSSKHIESPSVHRIKSETTPMDYLTEIQSNHKGYPILYLQKSRLNQTHSSSDHSFQASYEIVSACTPYSSLFNYHRPTKSIAFDMLPTDCSKEPLSNSLSKFSICSSTSSLSSGMSFSNHTDLSNCVSSLEPTACHRLMHNPTVNTYG